MIQTNIKRILYRNSLIILLLILFFNNAISQNDPSIEDDPNRNWDGITHWSRYIIMSPKYMGPNALPVPEIRNGLLNDEIEFEISTEYHFMKGDNTYNLFSKLYFPFAKNKIAVELYGVPVEYYQMDSSLRYERKTFFLEGEGFA
ncbi:MAG: hypothetical protein K8R58_05520, partial [Bacteroidales bacterium]|nr:hypothetical protein [Bacteroidales bacterium]